MGDSINEIRDDQRRRALEKANEVRLERAAIKKMLKNGTLDPLYLIAGRYEQWEEKLGRWTLRQLLMATPGVADVLTLAILRAFHASPSMRVSALTYARREELAELVAEALKRTWPP